MLSREVLIKTKDIVQELGYELVYAGEREEATSSKRKNSIKESEYG